MKNKTLSNIYFSVAIGLSGVITSCHFTLVNRLAFDLGHSAAAIGALVSLYTAGTLSGNLLSGYFADSVGKRRMIRLAFPLAALGACLLLPGLPDALVYLGIYLLGTGSGCNESQSSAIITSENPNRAARWMNISQMMYCIGAIFSPMLAIWFMQFEGNAYRRIYFLLSILIVCLTLLGFLPRLRGDESSPTRTEAKQSVPSGRNMLALLKRPSFLFIALMLFFYVGYESSSTTFLKPLFMNRGLSEEIASIAISVYWGFMVLGRFIGVFVKKMEANVILIFSLCFLSGAAALIFVKTPIPLFAGAALIGLGCGPVWPLLFVLGGRRHPEKIGAAFGILSIFSASGAICFPFLISRLTDKYNISFLLCAILCLALISLLLGIIKSEKRHWKKASAS